MYFNQTKLEKKFVICDGVLIMGQVEFHHDLVNKKNIDENKVSGGGNWYYDNQNNTIYFYGESSEFGQVSKEEFEKCFKQSSVIKKTLIFTNNNNYNPK